jgi:hypothetical protein
MDTKKITISVRGRSDYNRWTLYQWILEIKDLLEEEYGVMIDVSEIDGNDELPVLLINGEEVWIGLPGEEGYLVEIIKNYLENRIGLRRRID